MEEEKKNKVKGIFGTVLFHALLLLLLSLPFMSLTYQDPPPKKGGGSIAINFSSQKATETNPKPVKEEIVETPKKIITQTTTDALKVKKPEKKKKKPKEEVIKEKKQKVNEKALYPGKKKTTVTVGRNADADLGDLGNGGNGNEYQLGNRNPIVLPKPIYDSEAEGKVVVHIIVDQLGNVISAKPGEKGTTTQNKQLLANAKEAALKTKYPPKADAPNQHGKLIYTFQ
jgi:protein TonB